jgi:hypothetical protein
VIANRLAAKINKHQDQLFDLAIEICKSNFFDVLDADNVCPSVVPLFGTPVLDMITSDLLTELRFCNEFLGLCARPKVETLEFSDF